MRCRECNCVRRRRRASRLPAVAALAMALCAASAAAAFAGPQGPPPSYRLFLTDGTPLVSRGEFARVDGRVVFTVPLGAPSNPDALQTVSLPDSAIDWERTDRYADAVRHQSYASTRGEEDFAALTGAVARALGDIAFAADPSSKLAIAADIRRQLLEWPAAHYAYRSADVRDLTAQVEEAISQIRAGSGHRSFDLSLVATIEPPSEPLLAEPDLKEAVASASAVAQMTDRPKASSISAYPAPRLLGPQQSPRWPSPVWHRSSSRRWRMTARYSWTSGWTRRRACTPWCPPARP